MEKNNLFAKARVLLSVTLLFTTLGAFSQSLPESSDKPRSEVIYKQLHSTSFGDQKGLFADGLKLKMDLSILDDAEEKRLPI